MKQALIYSLKVWLTGMCLAFIGMMEVNLYTGLSLEHSFYVVALKAMIMLALLSPSYAIPFFLSVWVLLTMQWRTITLKAVLCGLTFVFGWFPFMCFVILTGRTAPFSFEVKRSILVYILLNWACIWFYSLNVESKPGIDNFS